MKLVYTKMQKALCAVLKQKRPNGDKGLTAKRASEIFNIPIRATSKWKETEKLIMPEIALIEKWDQAVEPLTSEAQRPALGLIGKNVCSMSDDELLLLWEHYGDPKLKEALTTEVVFTNLLI